MLSADSYTKPAASGENNRFGEKAAELSDYLICLQN